MLIGWFLDSSGGQQLQRFGWSEKHVLPWSSFVLRSEYLQVSSSFHLSPFQILMGLTLKHGPHINTGSRFDCKMQDERAQQEIEGTHSCWNPNRLGKQSPKRHSIHTDRRSRFASPRKVWLWRLGVTSRCEASPRTSENQRPASSSEPFQLLYISRRKNSKRRWQFSRFPGCLGEMEIRLSASGWQLDVLELIEWDALPFVNGFIGKTSDSMIRPVKVWFEKNG